MEHHDYFCNICWKICTDVYLSILFGLFYITSMMLSALQIFQVAWFFMLDRWGEKNEYWYSWKEVSSPWCNRALAGFFSSLYIFPFQFTVLMCYIEENKNGSGLVQSPGAKGYDLGPSPRKFALMFFIQFIHSVKKYSLVKYSDCRCVPGS